MKVNELNKKQLKEIKEDRDLLKKYSGLVKSSDDWNWTGTRRQWEDYDNIMMEEVLTDEDGRPFIWSNNEEGDYKEYLD